MCYLFEQNSHSILRCCKYLIDFKVMSASSKKGNEALHKENKKIF